MDIERDTVVEIAISVTAVVLFALAILAIGTQYYDNGFSQEGAVALVGAVAGFVVVMSIAGYVLAGR